MPDKLSIYILGDYKSGAADGLAEFNFQNVQLLRDVFTFQFVEFDKQENKNYYHSELREGIRIHRFGSKDMSFNLPGAFRSWIQNIAHRNVMFHLSHIYNLNNYLVARALRKARIPYLITPHDSYVYCSSYTREKPFIKRLYRRLFVYIFDKYVLDNARVVHALTQSCVPCLQRITRTPVSVVENQVKDLNLKFNSLEINPNICFIGRFNIHQKGIDLALEAFNLFSKEYKTEGKISFILVGPVTPEVKASCLLICKALDIEVGEKVFFTGQVPEPERNSILMHSKVYMQLSRYEGFGLSVVQALSCGKPVIISKQIPIHNKITSYRAGFSVNNLQEAALALARIFALSTEEYREMAMNARRCYEEEFHPEVIKPQLVHLYKKVMEAVS